MNYLQLERDKERSANVGALVVLVGRVFLLNDSAVCATCLATIASYMRNLVKDLSNRKYSVIKLSNAFLHRTVVPAKGGMELLAFGPGGFRPTTSSVMDGSLSLESVVLHLARPTASAERKREVTAWIEKYISFLDAAVGMVRV